MRRLFEYVNTLEENHPEYCLTCTVYGENAHQLYKGVIYNLPYHILKCAVVKVDFDEHHMVITIKNF